MTTQDIQGYNSWETQITIERFSKYKIEVETQLNKKIKWLKTGKEEEYKFNPFNTFCENHEITPSYYQESNEVKERKNMALKTW